MELVLNQFRLLYDQSYYEVTLFALCNILLENAVLELSSSNNIFCSFTRHLKQIIW